MKSKMYDNYFALSRKITANSTSNTMLGRIVIFKIKNGSHCAELVRK